jgi:hypothetical protein
VAPLDAGINAVLPWVIRLAGLFWLVGAFMLFRQIHAEMAMDRMTSRIEAMTRKMTDTSEDPGLASFQDETKKALDGLVETVKSAEDRDDAARRGWIAGQAVVLAATALAMLLLHPFAAWLAALLVLGQGAYFVWREWTARHAPTPDAAAHARPSAATVNAGWISLVVAMLVWMAAFRGLLAAPV